MKSFLNLFFMIVAINLNLSQATAAQNISIYCFTGSAMGNWEMRYRITLSAGANFLEMSQCSNIFTGAKKTEMGIFPFSKYEIKYNGSLQYFLAEKFDTDLVNFQFDGSQVSITVEPGKDYTKTLYRDCSTHFHPSGKCW